MLDEKGLCAALARLILECDIGFECSIIVLLFVKHELMILLASPSARTV